MPLHLTLSNVNPEASPDKTVDKILADLGTKMKKAWVAVPSPVLRAEAFALPITVRTSNTEAHADMIYQIPKVCIA